MTTYQLGSITGIIKAEKRTEDLTGFRKAFSMSQDLQVCKKSVKTRNQLHFSQKKNP